MRPAINILIAILLFNFNTEAQQAKNKLFHEPGIYLGGNWSRDTKIILVPQTWVYINDFYIEARYNYEDVKTFSVHFGKPFNIEELKMEVTPTVGLVFGNFKGYSLGLNTDFSNSIFSGSSENQYCFSSVNDNFFFSWLKFAASVIKNFNAGASWQYTLDPFTSVFDVGPMFSFTKGAFELQFFAYNPWKENRYWQFGISYDMGLAK